VRQRGETLGMGVSVAREHSGPTFNLDGVDPPRTLLGGHIPPFASDRRMIAASVCDCGLSEQGKRREDESHKLGDEHSSR
jgi:hypothetical protein